MNTACPNCGAIYNVAEKDIGRKIKCKKCSTALRVSDDGLEVDAGVAPVAPVAAAIAVEDDGDDDRPLLKKNKASKYTRMPGTNPLTAVGGIPTVLFAFGVFLVIVFTSLPVIGLAGTDRAQAYVDKLKLEQKMKIDALLPKGKTLGELNDGERTKYAEDSRKIVEDYSKRVSDATQDAEGTRISNRRDVWMERYGLMFGFLFVAFGCIGYLRTDQPLVLRIVAAVVLTFMMMVMFSTFGSGGCGSNRLTGG